MPPHKGSLAILVKWLYTDSIYYIKDEDEAVQKWLDNTFEEEFGNLSIEEVSAMKIPLEAGESDKIQNWTNLVLAAAREKKSREAKRLASIMMLVGTYLLEGMDDSSKCV